jgi:hypothetical protein
MFSRRPKVWAASVLLLTHGATELTPLETVKRLERGCSSTEGMISCIAGLFLPLTMTSYAQDYKAEQTPDHGVMIVRLTDAARRAVSIVPSIGNRAYEMKVHGRTLLPVPTFQLQAAQTMRHSVLAPWATAERTGVLGKRQEVCVQWAWAMCAARCRQTAGQFAVLAGDRVAADARSAP